MPPLILPRGYLYARPSRHFPVFKHLRKKKHAVALSLAMLAAMPAFATTIEKADNALTLNVPASWVGGAVPGPGVLAQWDSTVTSANAVSLGADGALGMVVTNPGGDVTILDDGHTLTLSSLDMSAATRSLTIDAPIALVSKQTWNIKTLLTINGSMNAAATSGGDLIKAGNGTLVLAGAETFSVNPLQGVTISAGMIKLGSSGALNYFLENLTLGSASSVLDLAGNSARVAGLSGSGSIMNGGAATASLTTFANYGVVTTFSGFLGNPGATAAFTFVKGGVGDLILADSDVRSGGSLTLQAGRVWLEKAGAVNASTTLVLDGGRLTKVFSGTQSFAQTQVVSGNSELDTTGGTASHVISLGNIDRTVAGGTVDFASEYTATSGFFTSASLTSSGILGGWAVELGANSGWLTRDTTSAVSLIVPLPASAYSTAFAPGANTIASPTTVVSPDAATGSIVFNDASTLTLHGKNVVESGGILIGHNAPLQFPLLTPLITGTNSSITSGNGKDLIVSASNGPLILAIAIVDNGATSIALTKSGTASLTLSGPNTYSGGTYLNAGQIFVTSGSSLGSGPVWIRGGYGAATLILGNGVVLPNDFIVNDDGFGVARAEVDVPTGAATLNGNFTVPGNAPNYYNLCLSGGTLTLTGTHTSGSPEPNGMSAGTILGGNLIYAGSAALISYGMPIQTTTNGAMVKVGANLTFRDRASVSVPGLATGSGLTFGFASNNRLTLQDDAVINLGPSALDMLTGSGNFAGYTTLNLGGGSLVLGQFAKSSGTYFSGFNSVIKFNGTTIIAASASDNFLPAFPSGTSQTLTGIIQAGGARFDTAGFSVTVGIPLSHDTTLGSAADGGLTKLGPGTLTVAPATMNYTGPTSINQGAISFTGIGSANSVGIITGPGDLWVGYGTSAVYGLTSSGVTTGTWSIRGIHTIRAGIGSLGTSKVNALALAPLTSDPSTVNLTDNKFILESTDAADKSAKLSLVQSALHTGMHNGDWLGKGITSSTVAADESATGSHMLGLALYDNAMLGLSVFGGQQVDANSILVTTALLGDTNFDGIVDSTDENNVISHWQTAQSSWTAGDVNGDGFVDILDFTTIATHWHQTYTQAVESDAESPTALPVPEPASLALFLTLPMFLRRRNRGQHVHFRIRGPWCSDSCSFQ